MNLFNNYETYLEITDDSLQIIQLDGEVVYRDSFTLREEADLMDTLKDSNLSVKKARVLIPADNFFIKSLNLPLFAEDRIEEIINFQVLNKLPYNREEVYYDYHLQRTDNERLIVIIFAVEKELVDGVYKLCSEASVKVEAILPTGFLFYLLHREDVNQEYNIVERPVLFLDTNREYLNFSLFAEDRVYLRASRGLNNIEEEVERTLIYLEEEFDFDIEPLLVMNGTKISYNELDTIVDGLDNNESLWSRITTVKDEVDMDLSSEIPLVQQRKKRRSYLHLFLLLALIILVNGVVWGLEWQMKRDYLERLNTELMEARPVVNQVEELKRKYERSKEKLIHFEDLVNQTNDSYFPWLHELSTKLSQDTVIERLVFEGNRLVLMSGEAESALEVMKKLEDSKYFSNLRFIGSIDKREEGEYFKIAGDLTE